MVLIQFVVVNQEHSPSRLEVSSTAANVVSKVLLTVAMALGAPLRRVLTYVFPTVLFLVPHARTHDVVFSTFFDWSARKRATSSGAKIMAFGGVFCMRKSSSAV